MPPFFGHVYADKITIWYPSGNAPVHHDMPFFKENEQVSLLFFYGIG
jgi:hypothetical protein